MADDASKSRVTGHVAGTSMGDETPRPSFRDQVLGQTGKPIDLTMARIMDDLYDETFGRGTGKSVDGWSRVPDAELRGFGIDPKTLDDAKSGFKARIYGDGEGHYVLAFSGTDEGKDWKTNFAQGLGFETAQYNQAMALARQAKVAFGDEFVITGQSLGGGLAAAASLASNTPAVTFNAAGVHDKTLERIGLDPNAAAREAESGLIRRYAVKNEILTELQERTPIMRGLMPDALGHKIELPDPDPLSFWQKFNPVKVAKHAVELHYIESVIEAMEKASGQHKVTDKTLMSDRDHPLNPQYERSLQQVQAAEEQRGKSFDAQTQNLSGALALESHRAGIAVERVVFGDQGRVFGIQGATPETQRVFVVDGAVAANTPLRESSREGLQLSQSAKAESPSSRDAALEPTLEQANAGRSGPR
jgi:hypothetical protein